MNKINKTKIGAIVASSVLLLMFNNCSADAFKLNSEVSNNNLSSQLQGADPFFSLSWYLQNLGQSVFSPSIGVAGQDLNVQPVWNQNYFGSNVRIQISDSGLEDNHEDLRLNFSTAMDSKDYTLAPPYLSMTSRPKNSMDNHGTSVAGLAAATHGNSLGSRGVASLATITSANFLSTAVAQTSNRAVDQLTGSFDISNMSWGINHNTLGPRDLNFENQMRLQTTTGRNNLGKVFVKASGNSFLVYCRGSNTQVCIGNSGFDPDANTPYTTLAASLDHKGVSSSYSSPGSNVWISAFGGEFGDDSPATLTTDRSGCSEGYAVSNSQSTVLFQRGQNGNVNCNYTATFNGTSSAAPLVSGAAALLLQLRPNLTWRDLKYIFARTAVAPEFQTVTPIGHPLAEPVPVGHQWELPWVVNSAGFRFHNWYGFGKLDISAAFEFAKTYVSTFGAITETNWVHNLQGLNLPVPDFSAAGVTSQMSVAQNLKAESVQLMLWVTHADISELSFELVSPQGTRSIIVNGRNSLQGISNYQGELFLSNAFYQENIQGNWILKVVDAKTGNPAGTLTRWSLNFLGAP